MKKKFDLSLYLVLDANLCMTPDGMVETTRKAIDGGCTIVQLRAPEWKKKKVLEAARKLKALLEPEGIPLIINDHIDVALLSKADGLHVGQDDISPTDARALLGKKAVIGLSIGSGEEMREADPEADYFGIGPVYATQTKKDAGAAVGIEGLKELCAMTEKPCVAIGGINRSNAFKCVEAGADGVAVVSAICGADDPEAATAAILQETDLAKRS